MSNSPLVVYTKLSPNHSGKRSKKIDTITIHCMAGNCSVETCGNLFASSSRQASSNYGIGTDGRIALYVDEANRSWCTSSNANDQRAVTIEVANNGGAPDWPVSAKAYAALLDLVTDICKRNGIKRLVWSTSKNDRVNHLNGCNMTVHRDYANKSCPGDYLYNRHGQIAAEVNKRLGITDAGGSTGGQTSGNTETGLKVGDVVDFKGTQHYTSAAAKDAKTCKPGKATITAVAAGKAHPYHLKAISGGGSTVYGWVNAADISNTNGIPVSLFNLLLSREDTRNVPPAPIQTAAVNTSASRRLFSRPSRTAPIARSIGNRPLHGIIAFVQTAVSFSARVGMILHPVTPTALHPRPIHIVSAWRPEVPQRAKMWSVRKAARGRYPASSRTENRKKKIAAGGSITAVTRAAVA